MLRGRFESAGELSPADLRSRYDDLLAETIEAVGPDRVAEQSGVDEGTIAALAAGESPALTLDEAAAILATDEGLPDADSIAAEARDILLMGMSIAVLDVEAVAAGLDDELEPKEIHGKVEGRYPMTLDEYAMVHRYIEHEKR
ncbi:MAG: DUF5791 family protein [Haloferacaceae archaeon]